MAEQITKNHIATYCLTTSYHIIVVCYKVVQMLVTLSEVLYDILSVVLYGFLSADCDDKTVTLQLDDFGLQTNSDMYLL